MFFLKNSSIQRKKMKFSFKYLVATRSFSGFHTGLSTLTDHRTTSKRTGEDAGWITSLLSDSDDHMNTNGGTSEV